MSKTVDLHFELEGERYEFSVTAGKKQNLEGCIYHTISEKFPQFTQGQPGPCMCMDHCNCDQHWYIFGNVWVATDPAKPWIGEHKEVQAILQDKDGDYIHDFFFIFYEKTKQNKIEMSLLNYCKTSVIEKTNKKWRSRLERF